MFLIHKKQTIIQPIKGRKNYEGSSQNQSINQSINVTSLKSNYQGKSLNDKTQNIQQDKFVSFGENSKDLFRRAYGLACEVERCAKDHDYEGGVIAEEELSRALDKYLNSLSLDELKEKYKNLFCMYYID